jgi:hypothetical protein
MTLRNPHPTRIGRAPNRLHLCIRWWTALFVLGILLLPAASPAHGQEQPPDSPDDFIQTGQQGFGSRHNSHAWSMVWWRGKLYVGTGRATQCVQNAIAVLHPPTLIQYPVPDADVDCTGDPADLPLRAEIWRWTPESNRWDLVYQSPNDVPVPGKPGKFTARDIGFRSMLIFREPDGTEALYVGGTNANSFLVGVPPPRILRSTDGVTFQPIPQAAGTFLGDIDAVSFRSMLVYKNRLYVVASIGYEGFGKLLEASDPKQGNNAFRQVLADEPYIFEMAVFNGFLYLGTAVNVFSYPADVEAPPFQLLKTDAGGQPPYRVTTVIADGAGRTLLPSHAVVSMAVFQGYLFVGTDRPAELIRVAQDDDWDLIVGTPRNTSLGLKRPLSGLDVGFDNWFNIHIWRMIPYAGRLFIGTMDNSTNVRTLPYIGRPLAQEMGFDLYSTTDGVNFTMITRTGFGSQFDVGVRNFEITSRGLVIGTSNHFYGARIFHEVLPISPLGAGIMRLPLIRGGAEGAANATAIIPTAQAQLTAPTGLLVDESPAGPVLSWETVPGAARYAIWRATYSTARDLGLAGLDPDAWVAGPFEEIGATDQPFYTDTSYTDSGSPGSDRRMAHYYVIALDAAGKQSPVSTIARSPSLAPSSPLLLTRRQQLAALGVRVGEPSNSTSSHSQ